MENNFNPAPDAGAQGATPLVLGSQPAATVAKPQVQFDPKRNIDTRDRASQASRQPNMQPVYVADVRRYVDQRGNPRVALNQGAIHLSQRQLTSAQVFVPESLQGKEILVDFFIPGDILLNGSIVTDGGRIVNRFAVQANMEAVNKLEYELMKESHFNWASKASTALGANNRPSGQGTSLQDTNGRVPAGAIPAMAELNQSTGGSANAFDGGANQGGQSAADGGGTGTPDAGQAAGGGNNATT
jgi:hypothetical protein